MLITNNNYQSRTSFYGLTHKQMKFWKEINQIPLYTDATYSGYTGTKLYNFPLSRYFERSKYPDITEMLHHFETNIFQELQNCRGKKFGYIRALWKMCRNLGTGDPWDLKFLPKFPGRDKKGQKQYAIYKNEIVSANDVSNLFFGHICRFMGIPTKLAQIIAKLDAAGILEPFSKGKMPTVKLLKFRDTKSDQSAIAKGVQNFDINDYKL